MDLDQQIQTLITNAPQDGTTPDVVEAIAPALKAIAEQLHREQYYILQTLDERWVLTTLRNLDQPKLEKRVLYAYPNVKDASARAHPTSGATMVAVPLPVIHILFQMLAIQPLDSIVFLEIPGNLEAGTEVKREEIQGLVQEYLQRYQVERRYQADHPAPYIPPDLA
ncbi:MAG: hypothetical protein HC835_01295 [Oscillatoriales cyanobacterium RM2_1_1]|nr:hypothetical protein [Oscillatoriales cyanobacterium SM2_3_0]NJO44370.1 hypothetical protein [Oscillatoriales cyanobacterium RM2_1_1]